MEFMKSINILKSIFHGFNVCQNLKPSKFGQFPVNITHTSIYLSIIPINTSTHFDDIDDVLDLFQRASSAFKICVVTCCPQLINVDNFFQVLKFERRTSFSDNYPWPTWVLHKIIGDMSWKKRTLQGQGKVVSSSEMSAKADAETTRSNDFYELFIVSQM